MKKLFTLLAVATFALTFVACGEKKADNTATEQENVEAEEPVMADDTVSTETPSDTTVVVQ